MEEIEININIAGVRQAKSDMKSVVNELKNVNNMLNYMTDGMTKNLGNVQTEMNQTKDTTVAGGGAMAKALAKAMIAVELLKGAFNLLKGVLSRVWGGFKSVLMAGARLDRLKVVTRTMAKNVGVTNEELEVMESALGNIRAFGSQAWVPMQSIIRTELTPAIKDLGSTIDKVDLEKKFKKPASQISDLEAGMFSLTETAKNFAAASPELVSSGDAIKKISSFIVTGRDELLTTLGITRNLNEVYRSYATEVLGVDRVLTDQEKRAARLNLILEEGETVVGAYGAAYQTAEKNIGSMRDVVVIMSEALGESLQPMFSLVTGTVVTKMQEMRDKIIDSSEGIRANMEKLRDRVVGAFQLLATGELTEEVNEKLGEIGEESGLVKLIRNVRVIILNIKAAFARLNPRELLGAFTNINIAEQLQDGGVIDDLKKGFLSLTGTLKRLTASETFIKIVDSINLIIQGLNEFTSGIGAGFVEMWKEIKDVFVNELKPAFQELWGVFGEELGLANSHGGDFKDTMKTIGKFVGKVLGTLTKWIVRVVSWLIKAYTWYIRFGQKVREVTIKVINAIKDMVEWIKSIPDRVKAKIDELKQKFNEFTTNATLAVQTFVTNAVLFIQSLPERVYFFIGQMLAHIVKFATIDAPNAILGFVNNAVAFIQSLPQRTAEFIAQVKQNIINNFTAAKNWVFQKIEQIKAFIGGLPGKASEAGSGVWSTLKSWFAKAKNFIAEKIKDIKTYFTTDLPNSVKSFADKAVGFINGIPGRIKAALDSLVSTFKEKLNIIIDGYNSVASKTGIGKINRLQAGTNYFVGGLAETGEFGREMLHLPKGSAVTSSRRVDQIEGNLLKKLISALQNTGNTINVNQPQFNAGHRSNGQQMNNFNSLLMKAVQ